MKIIKLENKICLDLNQNLFNKAEFQNLTLNS